jgi:hypothetical protein
MRFGGMMMLKSSPETTPANSPSRSCLASIVVIDIAQKVNPGA